MATIQLPASDGSVQAHTMSQASRFALAGPPIEVRTVYAAAHTVMDARNSKDPWDAPAVDWDATMAFRHRLWALGMTEVLQGQFDGARAHLEESADLFRRFQRGPARTTTGSGLGLPIVAALAEAHGGTAGVTGEDGHFTAWIALP